MNRKKKIVNVLIITLSLIIALPAMAWFESQEVQKAQDFVDMGKERRAIDILLERVRYEAKDFDAYWLLGVLYLKRGDILSSKDFFSDALKLKPGKEEEVLAIYRNAYKTSLLSEDDIEKTHDLALAIADLDPVFKNGAYKSFLDMAKDKDKAKAEKYLDAAMSFAFSPEKERQVAKRYLILALEYDQDKHLIRKAENILGDELVKKILPQTKTVAVYQKTFTEDMGDEYGRIVVFKYHEDVKDFRNSDLIKIQTYVPQNAPGIKIERRGEWVPIPKNDFMKIWHSEDEYIPSGAFEVVYMPKGYDMKVKVVVTRTITTKPNLSLLASI